MIDPKKYLVSTGMRLTNQYLRIGDDTVSNEVRFAYLQRKFAGQIQNRLEEKIQVTLVTSAAPSSYDMTDVTGRVYILSEQDMKEFINSMLTE